MNRALAFVLFLALFVAAVSLVLWLTRHLRAKNSLFDGKVGLALAAMSFVFVGMAFIVSSFPGSGKPVAPSGRPLPPEFFFAAATAMFLATAMLATIGLLLAAAVELVWSWYKRSAEGRRNAGRLALYAVGAFLVMVAHHVLLRIGTGLLN
jgi:hypothetical protein